VAADKRHGGVFVDLGIQVIDGFQQDDGNGDSNTGVRFGN